jgi:hypothetical protein
MFNLLLLLPFYPDYLEDVEIHKVFGRKIIKKKRGRKREKGRREERRRKRRRKRRR